MGSYLATPCRDVDEEIGDGNGMQYGVGEMQVGYGIIIIIE
jgi:hypothetical protein